MDALYSIKYKNPDDEDFLLDQIGSMTKACQRYDSLKKKGYQVQVANTITGKIIFSTKGKGAK